MDNILKFPSKDIRDWEKIKTIIKESLEHANATKYVTETVLERMKDVFDEFQFNYQISFKCPLEYQEELNSNLAAFMKELHAHTSELLFSRLILEIKLANLEESRK